MFDKYQRPGDFYFVDHDDTCWLTLESAKTHMDKLRGVLSPLVSDKIIKITISKEVIEYKCPKGGVLSHS